MLKPLVLASVSLLVGAVAGWLAHAQFVGPRAEVQRLVERQISGSVHATTISLAALLALERGDAAGAKRQLARQIASYEHNWSRYDGALPDSPKLVPLFMTPCLSLPSSAKNLRRRPVRDDASI